MALLTGMYALLMALRSEGLDTQNNGDGRLIVLHKDVTISLWLAGDLVNVEAIDDADKVGYKLDTTTNWYDTGRVTKAVKDAIASRNAQDWINITA